MVTTRLSPTDEAARIAAVRRYDILDTPPDGAFDRIAASAAELFGVPIGIVSIVDSDRIWFKSHVGLDGLEQIDRDPGLCASAIMSDEPWIVTDASHDPRTLANPLVAGDFGLRFYAGAALTTSDGFNLGTLCVLDRTPREVTEAEARILTNLASIVVDELELRLSARRALALSEARLLQTQELASALQRSLLPPALPDIPHVELAAAYLPSNRHQVGGDFYDIFPIDDRTWGLTVGDVCGKGPDAAGRTSCARYSMRAAAIHEAVPSAVLELVNQALLVDRDPSEDAPFVTAVYARLEPSADGATLRFASAGHPPPAVLRADGNVEIVGPTGALLGVFDQVRAVDVSVHLSPGDTAVLVTDGVLDSGLPRLEEHGLVRLLESCRGLPPKQIAERLQEAAAVVQTDDVAVLVVTAR